MIRFFLCLPILLWPALVQATCPTYFYPSAAVYAPTYAPPTVIKKYTIFDFTPGVAVGLYGTGHGLAPAQAAPAAAPCTEEIKSLKAQLEELKARLSAPVAPQSLQPPPMAPVSNLPSVSVIVTHCASCHDQSVAKEKGNAIELTAFGQALKLSPALAGKVMAAANPVKGSMPKDHPRLSGEQFNGLVKELITMQSQ